jgi:hypothetical protein
LASVGIAAHEVGHAIQDRTHYRPLRLRNGIVPLASVGPGLSIALILLGAVLQSLQLVLVGIVIYSTVVLFQLVNLPVELDASRRACRILVDCGIVVKNELPEVRRVLNAAALTYVAATVSAIFTLLYFLLKAGLLGSRDES